MQAFANKKQQSDWLSFPSSPPSTPHSSPSLELLASRQRENGKRVKARGSSSSLRLHSLFHSTNYHFFDFQESPCLVVNRQFLKRGLPVAKPGSSSFFSASRNSRQLFQPPLLDCSALPAFGYPTMEFSSSPPASRRQLNLDDDDDDELSVVAQSPYFTQPTQVVERPTSRPPPVANSSPRSIVEVPASSPFRPQALQQRGGRLANLMAPAGTAFRAPARQALPIQKTAPKRDFIMISDDELDAPMYAGGDSSENEQPSRGDIRPSSFRPKEPATTNTATGAQLHGGKTVSLFPEPAHISSFQRR